MLDLPPPNVLQIGIDEAGRGALAFPVCSAAVVLPSSLPNEDEHDMKMLASIRDSKKMTKKQRTQCAEFIKRYALAYDINFASVEEIDTINIMNATFLSMHRCIRNVMNQLQEPERRGVKILVDGDRFRPYFDESTQKIINYECVCKGDSVHMNIAAASILAKVGRDDLIYKYCKDNPEMSTKYGFSSHMAYGTKHHLCALKFYGPIDVHRVSFSPVLKYIKDKRLPQRMSISGDFGVKHFNAFKNVRAFRKDDEDDDEAPM